MDQQDDLVSHYREELEALRRAGSAFATRYPQIAGGLELGANESADPHVERLIESFAFLTARLQKRMDDRFPQITTSLLETLYPHLAQCMPPMSIAQCTPDPALGKLTTGYRMPRGTAMFANTQDGISCRFRTAYDTTVWPLQVSEAGFIPKNSVSFLEHRNNVQSVLRLRLEPVGASLPELELSTLRFHLCGEAQLTGMLYEMLLGHLVSLAIRNPSTGEVRVLPAANVRAVGFGENENLLPAAPQSHPGYRLLQEYFTLPEKFLFFDVSGLDQRPDGSAQLELLFLVDTLPRHRMQISPDTFRLGCVPIVNLFTRTSEPVRIDHRRSEYRLIPDHRRERTTEIHSIVSVINSTNPNDIGNTVRPFYDFSAEDSPATFFWHARQDGAEDSTMAGTDTWLSFVDLNFDARIPPRQTVYAQLLCTNRALAAQLPERTRLSMDEPAPLASITCLLKPTSPAYPPIGGASRWALISNLSVNHVSLAHGANSLAALKKMLRLYALHEGPTAARQIEGIREMSSRTVARRTGTGWQGWAQGTQVALLLDESFYEGVSLYLFASVLRYFFALYGSVNSFSELVINTVGKSVTHRFPLIGSEQPRF